MGRLAARPRLRRASKAGLQVVRNGRFAVRRTLFLRCRRCRPGNRWHMRVKSVPNWLSACKGRGSKDKGRRAALSKRSSRSAVQRAGAAARWGAAGGQVPPFRPRAASAGRPARQLAVPKTQRPHRSAALAGLGGCQPHGIPKKASPGPQPCTVHGWAFIQPHTQPHLVEQFSVLRGPPLVGQLVHVSEGVELGGVLWGGASDGGPTGQGAEGYQRGKQLGEGRPAERQVRAKLRAWGQLLGAAPSAVLLPMRRG